MTALIGGGPKTPALDKSQGSKLRKWALYGAALLFLVSLALGLSAAVDWWAFSRFFHGSHGHYGVKVLSYGIMGASSGGGSGSKV